MIGLVTATAAGRRHAERLVAAWPHRVRVHDGPVADALRTAWAQDDAVVAFLATGAAVRLLAPLLADKRTDPPVVTVDEAARFAVALCGGHAGGNVLAEEVAKALGATPVVTTASDAAGHAGLDGLGMPVEGDVAAVGRALLDGDEVLLVEEVVAPRPALPENATADAQAPSAVLVVTDRVVHDHAPPDPRVIKHLASVIMQGERAPTAVLRPGSLVVGVGASRGVATEDVVAAVGAALERGGLSAASVRAFASADVKADEAGILSAAEKLGVPLVTWPAEALAAVDVPTPSEVVRAAVGTPSVSEAAALLGDRPDAPADGAELVVVKQVHPTVTVAVARHRPRGRLAVVGLGPGARDLLAPRARAELRRASVVVGLDQYVDQVRDLLRQGTRVLATGLGAEEARARSAVGEARAGHAVALVGSGDAGVYAMASPALVHADSGIDVVVVPGVTAGLAAAAVLGAPIGHDHAYLSLSDLHTPWPAIERRLHAVAEGDLVALLYNPRSRQRDWQLGRAVEILAAHRPPGTPVGVVRNASRPDETTWTTTLEAFDPAAVDMYSLVVVGSSRTRVVAGRMVTPREYRWQE